MFYYNTQIELVCRCLTEKVRLILHCRLNEIMGSLKFFSHCQCLYFSVENMYYLSGI